MPLGNLIGKLQSPAFRTVAEIVQHAGSGMTVARFQSIRFPTGACQVWEFTPALPPLDRPPVVVAVWVAKGRLESWSPAAVAGYDAAVAHYRALAAATWAKAEGTSAPDAVAPVPANAIALPALPPGVRVTLPPTLGGKPVVLAGAAGGAP